MGQVEDPSKYGVVVTDDSGRVERFVEKPKVSRLTLHPSHALLSVHLLQGCTFTGLFGNCALPRASIANPLSSTFAALMKQSIWRVSKLVPVWCTYSFNGATRASNMCITLALVMCCRLAQRPSMCTTVVPDLVSFKE